MSESPETRPMSEDERLLAPLRLSADDPPERRRRAALEFLESAGFAAGPWEAAAVLAAFERENDPALQEARHHVRLRATREAASALAEGFYGLSRPERKRSAAALAESAAAGSALEDDLKSLTKLAAAKLPATAAMPAGRAAMMLAAMPVTDRAQLAAALVTRERPAGTGIPPAVQERSGLPPFFLVPEESITGVAPSKVAAAPPGPSWSGLAAADPLPTAATRGARAQEPTKPWKLTLVCLFGVWALIRVAVTLNGPASPRSSPPTYVPPGGYADPETEQWQYQDAVREQVRAFDTLGGSLPAPSPQDLIPGIARELVPVPPKDVLAVFPRDWVTSLPKKPAEALRRLEGIRAAGAAGLAAVLRADAKANIEWVDGRTLQAGELAPGVRGADLPDVFATLRAVEAGADPADEDLAAAEGWLVQLSAGVPARPPFKAGGVAAGGDE